MKKALLLASALATISGSFAQAPYHEFHGRNSVAEPDYPYLPYGSSKVCKPKHGNNQRKRRKLIRQNPHLLRSKKYR